MTLSLLVMAAGVGSRFGGLKQLVPVGPAGEVLVDYSVFDALRAGVERIVFVLRREMEADFHARLGSRYAGRAEVVYAFQEIDDLPPGFAVPPERTKPWGTGQAVLAAAGVIDGPFLVINADDFYGADGFASLAAFLRQPPAPQSDPGPQSAPGPERYAMVAYPLAHTLSEHGTVSRGVCTADPAGRLLRVEEHPRIAPTADGAVARAADGSETRFTGAEPVSLNFWGFQPSLFPHLAAAFERFLAARAAEPSDQPSDRLSAELYLPAVVDELIRDGRATVQLLPTTSPWFGVTYREDRDLVARRLAGLVAAGVYPSPLWPTSP